MFEIKKTVLKIVEIIIINFIVYYIFVHILSVKEEFLSLNLHPLILVVLIISLRYGMVYGIITATFSSLIYLYVYYLLGRDLYILFVDFMYYKFLLMFYLTAIIIGKFKDKYRNEKIKLNNRIVELEQYYKKVKEENKNYEMMHKELKHQVIGAEHSLLSLYDIAKSLQTLDPEDVFTKVIGVYTKFINAEEISIYTREKNDLLRLKIRYGNIENDKSSIDINDVYDYRPVIKEKRAVKRTKNSHNDFSIFTAPVLDEKGEVIAVISIDSIAFERVTDYNFTLFKVITDWVNQSLNYAIEYAKNSEDSKYQRSNIVSYKKFTSLDSIHKERYSSFKLEYCKLSYRLSGEDSEQLKEMVSKKIRRVDYVSYDREKDKLFVLLPATKKKYVNLIIDKLQARCNINFEVNNV